MLLEIVFFGPEFFLLFSFFVFLLFGTGKIQIPVAEILMVTPKSSDSFFQPTKKIAIEKKRKTNGASFVSPRLKGPNHGVSALTLWRITLSVLTRFLLFESSSFCVSSNSLENIFSLNRVVFLGGCFEKDAYRTSLCFVLLTTRTFVFLRISGWMKNRGIWQGEYIYLSLLALIGGYFIILATDLMALYLCLELQRFSLIVLCASQSKNAYSLEAAIKYFLLSAFRSCLFLAGRSFLYLETGETSVLSIRKILERKKRRTRDRRRRIKATTKVFSSEVFSSLGIWLISLRAMMKLGAAPLHMWVPDVLIGALSSVRLWVSLVPKIAILRFWTNCWQKVWNNSLFAFGIGETNILGYFRLFSLIVGRIAPLRQTSLKRLLAYSSIGHMGLILLPLCCCSSPNQSRKSLSSFSGENVENSFVRFFSFSDSSLDLSVRVLWTYMFVYILLNLGVWSLLLWPMYRPTRTENPAFASQKKEEISESMDFMKQVEKALFPKPNLNRRKFKKKSFLAVDFGSPTEIVRPQKRGSASPNTLWDLKSLNRSSPFAACRWAVFIRSLAGLPPMYSFLRKRRIFWNRANNGLYVLVFVSLLYTLVASVYYLKVIQICYVDAVLEKNKNTSWRCYEKASPTTAYIISRSLFILLLGLWHGNFLFLASQLLSLSL